MDPRQPSKNQRFFFETWGTSKLFLEGREQLQWCGRLLESRGSFHLEFSTVIDVYMSMLRYNSFCGNVLPPTVALAGGKMKMGFHAGEMKYFFQKDIKY